MRARTEVRLKGTHHYKGPELLRQGVLSIGLPLRLEHQPTNPHDSNAVAVHVKRTGAKLGYLPRELAPKYAGLLREGHIGEVSLSKIEEDGPYLRLYAQILHEVSDQGVAAQRWTRLGASSSAVGAVCGVYEIQNLQSGRRYIGSSVNLKDRLRSHVRELMLGTHANSVLQQDYNVLGPNQFEVTVLRAAIDPTRRVAAEAECIDVLLESGVPLYNLTADGQGRGRRRRGALSAGRAQTISGTFAEQRAALAFERRNTIVSEFEQKVRARLPRTWMYGIAVISAALALFHGLFNLTGIVLFFVTVVTTALLGPALKHTVEIKAKEADWYTDLVKERDERLRSVE